MPIDHGFRTRFVFWIDGHMVLPGEFCFSDSGYRYSQVNMVDIMEEYIYTTIYQPQLCATREVAL